MIQYLNSLFKTVCSLITRYRKRGIWKSKEAKSALLAIIMTDLVEWATAMGKDTADILTCRDKLIMQHPEFKIDRTQSGIYTNVNLPQTNYSWNHSWASVTPTVIKIDANPDPCDDCSVGSVTTSGENIVKLII